MSDFRVHPVLISPPAAAAACAAVTMSMVDAGVADLLNRTGTSTITAEDWKTIIDVRWLTAAVSAVLGWMAWTLLFHHRRVRLDLPAAGMVLGILAPVLGVGFIRGLYLSIQMPEYRDVYPVVQPISLLWSVLALMCCAGCVLLGVRGYRALRGRS
jgi:hypothetical protein